MKAIIFRSFRSRRKYSPTNYRFSTLARSLTTKNGKEIETVASTPDFNMFLQGTICVSARIGKSFAKCSLVRRKKYVSGYVWHRTFIQMVKYSFLDERIV